MILQSRFRLSVAVLFTVLIASALVALSEEQSKAEMERSCGRGAKEESRCRHRIFTRCRPEDLFENLRYVSRENRRRGWPGRD